MADQNEIVASLLDNLAAEVMVLEPGDLMTYGRRAYALGGVDPSLRKRRKP